MTVATVSEVSGRRRPDEVVVTRHAAERLDRIPPLRPLTMGQRTRLIRIEVGEAVEYGRCAKREPSWLLDEGSERVKVNRGSGAPGLFCWDTARTRCYVVAIEDQGRRMIVTTVLV